MEDLEIPEWLKGLPLAPEYRPTETEFADPIAYISQIEKDASQFGICKIIPPFPRPAKKYVFANLNKSLAKLKEHEVMDQRENSCPVSRSMGPLSSTRRGLSLMGHVIEENENDGLAVFTTRHQELGWNPRKIRGAGQSGVHMQVWQSGESYSLEQFESKSRVFARNQFGSYKETSPLLIETLFWKAASEKPIYVEYANDIPGSGFGEPEGLFKFSYRRHRRKKINPKGNYSANPNKLGRERNMGLSTKDGNSGKQPNKDGAERNFGLGTKGDTCVEELNKRGDETNIVPDTKDGYHVKEASHDDIKNGCDLMRTLGDSELSFDSSTVPLPREGQRSREKTSNYGGDMEGTAGWRLANSPWNLQIIARSPGSLTRYMADDIPGVTSPMIYIGMLFSWFAWHVEDHELHSLNFLHTGSPKTWYAVPGDAASSFEEVVRLKGYGGHLDSLGSFSALGEKTTLLSPEIIVASGIRCCRLVQHPGEFVVTFPRAYHVGFSHGFNCGEAANFATPQWLKVAKEAAVRRAALSYLPMLSHQQLLYMLTLSFDSRIPAAFPAVPRRSRLRDKKKEDREMILKEAFIGDMKEEMEILNILIGKKSAQYLVSWDPELLPAPCDPSLRSSPATGKMHLNPDEKSLNFCNKDAHNLLHDGPDELSLAGFHVDSGTLTCVACGVLGFPCMAVIQPSEQARKNLYSEFDEVDHEECGISISLKSQCPTLVADDANPNSDVLEAPVIGPEVQKDLSEEEKQMFYENSLNPTDVSISYLDLGRDSSPKCEDHVSESQPAYVLDNIDLLSDGPKEACFTSSIVEADTNCHSLKAAPPLKEPAEMEEKGILVTENFEEMDSKTMSGSGLEKSCNNAEGLMSGPPGNGSSQLTNHWNLSEDNFRPRIFCLEHAFEVDKMLQRKGGVNMLLLCHSDYPKIQERAVSVAEEIGANFNCKGIPLVAATPSELELIYISIDDEEHEESGKDWTSKLGVNLQHSINLCKSSSAKEGHHGLGLSVLFPENIWGRGFYASGLKWKFQKSRSHNKAKTYQKRPSIAGQWSQHNLEGNLVQGDLAGQQEENSSLKKCRRPRGRPRKHAVDKHHDGGKITSPAGERLVNKNTDILQSSMISEQPRFQKINAEQTNKESEVSANCMDGENPEKADSARSGGKPIIKKGSKRSLLIEKRKPDSCIMTSEEANMLTEVPALNFCLDRDDPDNINSAPFETKPVSKTGRKRRNRTQEGEVDSCIMSSEETNIVDEAFMPKHGLDRENSENVVFTPSETKPFVKRRKEVANEVNANSCIISSKETNMVAEIPASKHLSERENPRNVNPIPSETKPVAKTGRKRKEVTNEGNTDSCIMISEETNMVPKMPTSIHCSDKGNPENIDSVPSETKPHAEGSKKRLITQEGNADSCTNGSEETHMSDEILTLKRSSDRENPENIDPAPIEAKPIAYNRRKRRKTAPEGNDDLCNKKPEETNMETEVSTSKHDLDKEAPEHSDSASLDTKPVVKKGTKGKREVFQKGTHSSYSRSGFCLSPCENLRPRSNTFCLSPCENLRPRSNDSVSQSKEEISGVRRKSSREKKWVGMERAGNREVEGVKLKGNGSYKEVEGVKLKGNGSYKEVEGVKLKGNGSYKEVEEEGSYRCDIERCTMCFVTKGELLIHKKNGCTIKGCRKRFNSHKYLVLHQRVHMEERPLKCTWTGCKMTFKWAWARTEHLRVHTRERPYKCGAPGCDRTFRFVSDISRHKRKTGHCVN
ncbi:probable lysine-specific demethylase ELF6 isoform X3 [Amborella trichopoda]|uniref:probable lysine-specific demethylase ELF6 isoform X2 n=1 Tax=Amborella trichopoda TaxID=13333 RepID=UPI0009C16F82|nr:probable lysine-specific demethylase ELF6 isoform X2 [Amborella trichopoda]XP_020525119.1 probable lysine-specific demethylase ELF6 isoform X3 [Amborella trichopoda]|eukprot:XP_020525115.1 probable lysine-specific demethylase ELF6 isoform X2 [Amborella trichopoda]